MLHQLRYGESSVLQVEVPPRALVADCTPIPGHEIDDLSAAVADALADPLGYPPLAAAVVPGDRIVVALDPDVPQPAEIIAGIVNTLLLAGIDAESITILQTRESPRETSLVAPLMACSAPVQSVVHAPKDPSQLAYLAASKDAQPILLNRRLCEADLVLPVSLLRPETALGYVGPHGGLCTAFSDEATQERFRVPLSAIPHKEQRHRRAETDEVAWLLGIQFTLQIVAGPGNTVQHVLAGQVDEVYRRGKALVDAAWSFHVPRKAQLVVATIEGDDHDQTWVNFGRALHAAQQVCAEDGTIILCTELQCVPGPALRRLAGYGENEQLLKRVRRDRSEDAVSASLLLESRDTMHVYLLSGLDEASVEAIGIGYIDAPEHVGRLTRLYDSCILLANAHRAAVRAH